MISNGNFNTFHFHKWKSVLLFLLTSLWFKYSFEFCPLPIVARLERLISIKNKRILNLIAIVRSMLFWQTRLQRKELYISSISCANEREKLPHVTLLFLLRNSALSDQWRMWLHHLASRRKRFNIEHSTWRTDEKRRLGNTRSRE